MSHLLSWLGLALALAGCGEDDTPAPPLAPADSWRSELYPQDWAPGHELDDGRALPDFSYAGYHNGETPLPSSPAGEHFDVVDHGADPTGSDDSTAAIQSAIDAAASAGGGVVDFPAGLYRCDDLLSVQTSGVVLMGQGSDVSRVHFTRHEDMSDLSHITFRGAPITTTEHPLVEDASRGVVEVAIEDASALVVGDDVAIGWEVSDAFVAEHEMAGTWQAFNGTWQTFFRRQVEAIDTSASPHRVTLDVPLRYPAKLRDGASLRVETGYLREVGVMDLGLANAVGWEEAWQNERVHVLELDAVRDGWILDVASFVSPTAPTSGKGVGAHLQSSGLQVQRSARVTVAEVSMAAAQNRGGGGCGYLFEIRTSSEVLTRDSVGLEGRHNFIQNWGFGASGLVWLRCSSAGGESYVSADDDLHVTGASEFHHSLAMANLIDHSEVDDGWAAINRGDESSGAGHTATQSVFYNLTGTGSLRSAQFGWGYVIGTSPELWVNTGLLAFDSAGTAPDDWLEGLGEAESLEPASLYEDQFLKRTGRAPETLP